MSNITFTANGSVVRTNKIVESMADTDSKPLDYLNLVGNLKLSGSVRATNFYKEDGTELQSITVNKLALPDNVYYVDRKMGINEEKPTTDLDVKGTGRVQGNFGIGGNLITSGTGIFKGSVVAEDEFMANKNAGVRGNFGIDGSFITQGSSMFRGPVTAESDFVANKNFNVGGNFGTQGTSMFKGPVTVESDFTAGNLNVIGNFGAQGTSMFKGAITAEDEFVANKNAGVRGNFGVGGNFGTQGSATFKGPVVAESEFNVNGIHKIGAPVTDANGEQLTIGNIKESNLRLGRHGDYSWIQSHGGKPLKINPLGNDVCLQDVCLNSADIKNLKSNASTTNPVRTPVLRALGIKSDGSQLVSDLTFDNITDEMNMMTVLPNIANNVANVKAAVFFNIKLKDPVPSGPSKFTVVSDDGIAFEYQNTDFLYTPFDWNGIGGSLSGIVGDYRGWKSQGATPYEYVIPNASTNGIIKCKLTWYQGGGGSAFQIKGLKTAIANLGTLA